MKDNDKTSLTMLGTGYAMAINCYNTCFALRRGASTFLVDGGGGNGIFAQLSEAGISIESVHEMFVTHAHTDHLLGVVWIVRKIAAKMKSGKYEGNFTVYLPEETKRTLLLVLDGMLPKSILNYAFSDRMEFRSVSDGEKISVFSQDFEFFDIRSTKMTQFGFSTVLHSGKRLVCLGDEPYNEQTHRYVEGADWLLAEAFCLYADRERFKPYEKHHSTAMDAAQLAQMLGVKNLLLYHTEDTSISTRKELYTKEAKEHFEGEVFVPNDLETIPLD